MNVREIQLCRSGGQRRGGWLAGWPALAGSLLLTTVFGGGLVGSSGSQPLEPAMRAAFVYHLTKFVEWPAPDGPAPAGELRVGVWGDPAMVPALKALLAGRTIAGRQAVVIAARRPEELANCQVVFLSHRNGGDIRRALERCAVPGTLTIGEGIDDLARQTIVSFEVRNDRIHFAVNREAASRAGLRLSSHLLNLATAVTSPTSAGKD